MTIAPLTRSPAGPVADPVPADPPPPEPAPRRRRPRLRAPEHEPEPLATGTMHPRRHTWNGMRPATPSGTATGPAARDADPAPSQENGAPAGPPPHARAGALVRSVLEVLAGRRQPGQLAAAVTPEVLRYLAASRPSTQRAVAPGRVHVQQPHPEAAEVVTVCRIGDRTRALSLRLDVGPPARSAAHGRGPAAGSPAAAGTWMCTAVRLI